MLKEISFVDFWLVAAIALCVSVMVIIIATLHERRFIERRKSLSRILFTLFSVIIIPVSAGLAAKTFIPIEIRNQALWPPSGGVLAEIKARHDKTLRCGVNGRLYGFSEFDIEEKPDEDMFYDNASGFDADFCRVVAAAVYGRNGKVKFINLDASERFAAVENGLVDVLFRNTSATAGREAGYNIRFGPTVLFDDQAFVVQANSEILNQVDFSDKAICVTADTTTEKNIRIGLKRANVPTARVVSQINGRNIRDTDQLIKHLSKKQCDVITGDRSGLMSSIRSAKDVEIDEQEQSKYRFLEYSLPTKELLSPVTVGDDDQWANIVKYSVYATIKAAELDIRKNDLAENVGGVDQGLPRKLTDPFVTQFFGETKQKGEVHLGVALGLEKDFAKAIVQRVGSYYDIYESNLDDVYRPKGIKGLNQLINHCDNAEDVASCGLLVSPPFDNPTYREKM